MRKTDEKPAKPDEPQRAPDDDAEVRFVSWDLPLVPDKRDNER